MSKSDRYRLILNRQSALHRQILTLLASALVLPRNRKETAANAVTLHRYAETFSQLSQLSPERLHTVAYLLLEAVEISISLSQLQKAVHNIITSNKKRERHLQQCEWLIRHGGSNHMILLLCYTLSTSDIRQMRKQLGIPVSKGRRPVLPMEVQLSVFADWQDSAGKADTFTRYQLLSERYPAYEVGQLFSTVASVEGGNL